ncbi:protein-disulfide isomerase [Candidatus Nitrososphaera evergladensis SR1]|uniref:Protein-disulfide isomerase n=1 Tax=Candidatus Nitrososphaera evergladensis SR1 TaxID=1459636 RepID=A0A075MQ76_9ARCH|nr:thioredoxin domain-containing protein [Candidatus Nitrososphaera evergladensis]AIF83220.1 protein-disulfide isomerase [Candidatus Nitrososphaera evergladensis SR1]
MSSKIDEAEIARLNQPVNERDHAQGQESAPVILVEYGDYECPYCGQAYPIVKSVQKNFGDKLRFIFRNFPITQAHPHAQHAAEAAEAAGVQGKFWEMHDYLYERQRELDENHLRQYASAVGLDIARFDDEMAKHIHAGRVHNDFMSGIRSGVNGTPTFYINDIRHDDSWNEETLVETIKQTIADQQRRHPITKGSKKIAGRNAQTPKRTHYRK